MTASELSYLPFFVYGTLIPGQPNDHYWQDSIISVTKGSLSPARLHDLGTFPMLIEPPFHGNTEGSHALKPSKEQVAGRLVKVKPDRYGQILDEIDRLEDYKPNDAEKSIYRRVVREISPENGFPIPAWVYIGSARHALAGPVVPDGDWIAYCASTKTEETMTAWWRQHGLDLLFGNFSGSE